MQSISVDYFLALHPKHKADYKQLAPELLMQSGILYEKTLQKLSQPKADQTKQLVEKSFLFI